MNILFAQDTDDKERVELLKECSQDESGDVKTKILAMEMLSI